MDRVVLDTNIYISGFLFPGNARKVLSLAIENRILVFITGEILNELSNVLQREKFALRGDRIVAILDEIERVTYPVYPDTNVVDVCRDSRDHIILECSLAANAEYIITGDKDLTVLQKFLGTVIITPDEYLELR